MLEGYWFYTLGSTNCGTQLKLSALLTGAVAVLLAYKYIMTDGRRSISFLKYIGDISFGIYFSHIAVMWVLRYIPLYYGFTFPLKAMITVAASAAAVLLGRKILGKCGWVLAL